MARQSAYWDEEAQARGRRPTQRPLHRLHSERRRRLRGHQLNWNTRLGVIERLDAVGVGEITMPSHITFSEERDS